MLKELDDDDELEDFDVEIEIDGFCLHVFLSNSNASLSPALTQPQRKKTRPIEL